MALIERSPVFELRQAKFFFFLAKAWTKSGLETRLTPAVFDFESS